MGNRPTQRAYDAVVANPTFNHEHFFSIKAGEPVLVAFILLPEEAGLTDNSLHRLISVTKTGVYQSVLRTGKSKRIIDASITLASVATAINRRKTFLYVTADDRIVVVDTSKMTVKGEIQSGEQVTAARMLMDGYFAYGTVTGKLWVVNPEDRAQQAMPCEETKPVKVIVHSKSMIHNVILAGFEEAGGQSALVLFNHVTVSNPFQPGQRYEGVSGTCADIVVLDVERLVLATAVGHPEVHIWDIENCSLLLKLALSPTTPISQLLPIGEVTPSGKVRLVAGTATGLIIGLFCITDSNVSWTQTSKSELKAPSRSKLQSGSVTSLGWEDTMGLLVYGDEKGQVWLLAGPSPIVEPRQLVNEPVHSDS